MRTFALLLVLGLFGQIFDSRAQNIATSKVATTDAASIATQLQTGMTEQDVAAFLKRHGISQNFGTNGVYSVSVGCSHGWTTAYPLADGRSLDLDFRPRSTSPHDVWGGNGLERQLSFPLLMALVDSRTLPQLTSGAEADSTGIQMSPQKRDLLRDGAHPIWNLTASASDGDGLTRFILRGTTMSLMAPFEESEMEFLYDVKDIGGKFICVKASFTNYTAHNALLSERGNFDSEGFPRYWKRTIIESNASPKHIDVVLKEIDLNPAFKNDVVFAPRFPTNYIVSDVTSGTAVILQNPLVSRVAEQPLRPKAFRKRILVLWVLGLVALATGVALWRFASKGQ